jgi:hypothetical protein
VWQPFADPPPAEDASERTASGLVRRVRGAHVRAAGTGGGEPRSPYDTGAPVRTPAIDGVEMQRFLTSLAGGVQRSLDGQTPGAGPGDEG